MADHGAGLAEQPVLGGGEPYAVRQRDLRAADSARVEVHQVVLAEALPCGVTLAGALVGVGMDPGTMALAQLGHATEKLRGSTEGEPGRKGITEAVAFRAVPNF